MWWLVFLSVVVIYAILEIRKKQRYWEERGVNYVKPTFLLGNMEIFKTRHINDLVKELYYQFPNERYLGIYQFARPTLIIKDPELIKQITIKDFDSFVDHQSLSDVEADSFWSKNLFASTGDRWRDMRSTLSPSFTGSKMKMMYELIDECARQFVEFFKNHEDNNKGVIELEMKDTLSRYTNDVIGTAAFGLRINSLKERNNEFYLMGKDATDSSGLRFLRFFVYTFSPAIAKLFKIKVIPPRVTNYFTNIITTTVRVREENKIVRPDMIHLLMEARKTRASEIEDQGKVSRSKKEAVTIEDIAANAFIFFFAGFDTISTLLTFEFYEIAVNPSIQDRLRKEINDVQGEINYEKLHNLKYMDMVISEALRKWNPAVFTDRKVTKSFTIEPKEGTNEKPLHLEEGVVCWIPIHSIHNDPKYYPDPEKFDPERFSDENKHKINPSAYLPFGSGPRLCIGNRFALMEAKLLTYYVIKNFEVVPIKRTSIPPVLDPSQFNPIVKGGMWLGFKKL